MYDGTYKKIIDVEVGDQLENSSDGKTVHVTAKMKLDANFINMYYLGKTIVSGTHQVKYNNKWIFVAKHPECKLIKEYNEPFIYCLNTTHKKIIIDDLIFCDWDEITEDNFSIFQDSIQLYSNNLGRKIVYEDIHTFFDRGYMGDTKLRMIDKSLKKIKDIKIGDVLSSGENVYGLVEIDGRNIKDFSYFQDLDIASSYTESSYNNTNKLKSCSSNNSICSRSESLDEDYKKTNNKRTSSLDSLDSYLFDKQNKLYHLLTDTKSFYVGQVKMRDYNSLIDSFLEKVKK